ncbi:unnamed protein product [Klebsiella pneumoniae]|nr:hypothetical protein KP13_04263 [Klebsiella pneumoniae subsp. pneumoniae Kp13]CDO13689.1 unnamed protein product [Klebsiella pneumoniae]DAV14746.1 MAG TPA: hypothetical protein [Caudoviricetes sp.]
MGFLLPGIYVFLNQLIKIILLHTWRQGFYHFGVSLCFMPFQSRTINQPKQPRRHHPSVNNSLKNLFLNPSLKLSDRSPDDRLMQKPKHLHFVDKSK